MDEHRRFMEKSRLERTAKALQKNESSVISVGPSYPVG